MSGSRPTLVLTNPQNVSNSLRINTRLVAQRSLIHGVDRVAYGHTQNRATYLVSPLRALRFTAVRLRELVGWHLSCYSQKHPEVRN